MKTGTPITKLASKPSKRAERPRTEEQVERQHRRIVSRGKGDAFLRQWTKARQVAQ